jgi:ABC-2 type transport system ATP-binding protein
MIEVKDVSKCYRQYRRFPGIIGAFRSLVTRQYTELTAVDQISFSINKGEAVGYLGPNGAGKSTMIKMLTGILVPSLGEVRVLGNVPHLTRQQNAFHLGVVFGQRSQLWWDLPVMDSFQLHKAIYKLSDQHYRHNLDFCVELLGLQNFLQQPVRQLSLGQRMRVEMAMAILHDPEILFLDEPTIGLDVMAKDQIRQFLRSVNKEKQVTLFLTTHDLKDIEEICPRMIIVNKGHLVYDGGVEQLRARVGNQRKIRIDFRTDPGPINLPGATLVEDKGLRKVFLFERGGSSAFDLISRLAATTQVEDVSLEGDDIESVIRTLYNQLEAAPTDDAAGSRP